MPTGHNPVALGRIVPAGATTRLTANFPSLYGNNPASLDLFASRVDIYYSSQAGGNIAYLGYSDMNITTGVSVLREMIAGETYVFQTPQGSLIHVGDFCVLGSGTTDYFQISAWEG